MVEDFFKWAVGGLGATFAGACTYVHRRIASTHRRIDRLEDELRADIRKGFRESSEGRGHIWQGLTDYRREMKEDLKSMEDRIVQKINGG